jgi:glycosyltransferase involved in cell wall biosynthesis
VIVAARDEEERIEATIEALRAALPGARIIVADDGSKDATGEIALEAGAEISSAAGGRRSRGKGGAMTAAARSALAPAEPPDPPTFLLCDGDLGATAGRLRPLVDAVESGECDVAIAVFARSRGGGFGLALGFARRALSHLTGLELRAPISGQRAIRGGLLPALLPFAPGFGIEIGMTTDAVRAGAHVMEIELDLEHRATTRTLAGFVHRGRQLLDFLIVYLNRRFFARRKEQPARSARRTPKST